jgi:hypothetical protein
LFIFPLVFEGWSIERNFPTAPLGHLIKRRHDYFHFLQNPHRPSSFIESSPEGTEKEIGIPENESFEEKTEN